MKSKAAPIAIAERPIPPSASRLYRFTVDQYDRMADLFEHRRVELIDGYVVKKMTKKPPHAVTVEESRRLLERTTPAGWHLRQENPVIIPDYDEPEPDLAVVRGTPRTYARRHPVAADIGLLVEVAETTLDVDRGEKLRAYARGKVPVYWIVNLVDQQIEVYTKPASKAYASCTIYKAGREVPFVLDGKKLGRIPVADILPASP
ncbi:MAG: Uma2 family endonuclease [Isosphaeraceae bacterium]